MTATHYLVMDLSFSYTGTGADTDEKFDEFTDATLEALAALECADPGLTDPDITATLTTREMTITMGVEADTLADALRIFSANVRTALHVSGCQTAAFELESPQLPPARRVDLADV
jgi:hypothetical protein